jgi:hypothetical protein
VVSEKMLAAIDCDSGNSFNLSIANNYPIYGGLKYSWEVRSVIWCGFKGVMTLAGKQSVENGKF